jgi:hypothetical protein
MILYCNFGDEIEDDGQNMGDSEIKHDELNKIIIPLYF